jgi:large subunit ribosomal protein L24
MNTNNKDRFKPKFKLKTGDEVVVIAGDYKGKKGKIRELFADKNRVLVDGINMISRHTKPNAKYPQGGIIKKEAPLHISNVALAGSDGKAVKVGRKVEDGKIVRIIKKTGEIIK